MSQKKQSYFPHYNILVSEIAPEIAQKLIRNRLGEFYGNQRKI